ncbi:DinB family protein [Pedobacter nanyangensis]|uniref:DinB family protein n=1 Tax=Pedobacter nanyangensis TaxID=1562389 RepID=UPI000DE4ADA4|nr:DinB family protein [Pedobacter nanyangensis]
MDIKEFIKYTKKADEIMMKALADTGFSIPDANTLLSHILSAQHIWAKRMLTEQPTYAVWEVFPPEDFEAIYAANLALLEDIAATKPPEEIVNYSNSAGEVFSSTVGEILMHVCNHGTYHRGQLAKMLKQAGYAVPLTDYIMLKRKGLI